HVTYVIGDELINGNLAYDTDWVVKYGGAVSGARLDEQRAARESTTHFPLLRELADLAGVGYGRFDYALVEGRICVWELNTDPTLLLPADEYPPEVRAERQGAAARAAAGPSGVAGGGGGGEGVRVAAGGPQTAPPRPPPAPRPP